MKQQNRSWRRELGRRVLRVLALTVLVMIAGGLIFKNELIFHPRRDLEGTPRNYGWEYKEVWLRTADGQRVKAWELPAGSGEGRAAVLFFQGNSGNMSYVLPQLVTLRSLGLTVLAVDYPGYGESEGRPSVAAAFQTAETLRDYAAAQGFTPENTIIYGFSLGGGVASHLAEKYPPAALVLDSTFTRLRDVPSTHLPPLKPYFKLILGDLLDTKTRLAHIHCPLLVIHRPQDTVVPQALGLELFESFQGPYKDLAVGSGDHMDFILNEPLYRERLQKLTETALPTPAP